MTMRRAALLSALAGIVLGAVTYVAAQPPEGNAARGAAAFRQCIGCHSAESGVHLTGPSLAHVWGRRAGTVDGFTRYSEPLKRVVLVWDTATLDRWLQDPQAVVPGNLMTFPGLKDERQRADLIACLSQSGRCRPAAARAALGGRDDGRPLRVPI